MATNLTSTFLLVRAAESLLRAAKGAVVVIASTRAHMSEPDTEAYAASKGALHSLVRALASRGAEKNIVVNGVAPGAILWPEDGQFTDAQRAAIVEHTLLKREGSADDIAVAVRSSKF